VVRAGRGAAETDRTDVAGKALMQCSLVAMLASGHRPAANEPGHHPTMVPSLPLAAGTANEVSWCWTRCARRRLRT
jgi:hypothetical protein